MANNVLRSRRRCKGKHKYQQIRVSYVLFLPEYIGLALVLDARVVSCVIENRQLATGEAKAAVETFVFFEVAFVFARHIAFVLALAHDLVRLFRLFRFGRFGRLGRLLGRHCVAVPHAAGQFLRHRRSFPLQVSLLAPFFAKQHPFFPLFTLFGDDPVRSANCIAS